MCQVAKSTRLLGGDSPSQLSPGLLAKLDDQSFVGSLTSLRRMDLFSSIQALSVYRIGSSHLIAGPPKPVLSSVNLAS